VKAVELRNRRTHWVYDAHQTLCGRHLIDLPVVRETDVENLSDIGEPCAMCVDLAVSGFGVFPSGRVTLKPSHGRMKKAGPISHGPRGKGIWQDIWERGE